MNHQQHQEPQAQPKKEVHLYPPQDPPEVSHKEIQMNEQDKVKQTIEHQLHQQHPNASSTFYQTYTNMVFQVFTHIEFYDFTLTFTGDKHEPDTITLSITPHYGS